MSTIKWGGAVQDSTPDDEARVEEAMHRAFSLAAQYIALAYALQPGKDVYEKSIQACSLLCAASCPSVCWSTICAWSVGLVPPSAMHSLDLVSMKRSRHLVK